MDDWIQKNSTRIYIIKNRKLIFKNHVLEELGDIYISEITPIKIQKLMDKWANKYDTAPKMMNYTGLVFKYAVRFGIIESNLQMPYANRKEGKKQQLKNHSYDKTNWNCFLMNYIISQT